MERRILSLFMCIFLIGIISASLPICSDTNQQDINSMPCNGFTVSIDCVENVTVYNSSDSSINFTFATSKFANGVYNFTLNLTTGGYELIDCENNTATIFVGLVEQGYGINLFGIMFPAIILSLISLFVSGRMYGKFRDDDEEEEEYHKRENDEESFVPKSRLMPTIFMLFAFIPIIFMIGFVNSYLQKYLAGANILPFYSMFYVLFSALFVFMFLVSIIVWLSSFIKLRRVMRGLDDID